MNKRIKKKTMKRCLAFGIDASNIHAGGERSYFDGVTIRLGLPTSSVSVTGLSRDITTIYSRDDHAAR